jgi:hypothetical protein
MAYRSAFASAAPAARVSGRDSNSTKSGCSRFKNKRRRRRCVNRRRRRAQRTTNT